MPLETFRWKFGEKNDRRGGGVAVPESRIAREGNGCRRELAARPAHPSRGPVLEDVAAASFAREGIGGPFDAPGVELLIATRDFPDH